MKRATHFARRLRTQIHIYIEFFKHTHFECNVFTYSNLRERWMATIDSLVFCWKNNKIRSRYTRCLSFDSVSWIHAAMVYSIYVVNLGCWVLNGRFVIRD